MNATDVIQRLHQHRSWVNRKLLDAAERLSEVELHREFAIGQGSVWRSLLHLWAAEYVWLEALQGNEAPVAPGDVPEKLPGNQQGEGTIRSLSKLNEKWTELENRWQAYLKGLAAGDEDEIVYKISTSSGRGKRYGTRRVDILLHLCTHAQYTTAQLVNMLRQLGHSPLPEVMLISLAREESQSDFQ